MNLNVNNIHLYITLMCLMSMLNVMCLIKELIFELVCPWKPSSINIKNLNYFIKVKQSAVELVNTAPCMVCPPRVVGTGSTSLLRLTNLRMDCWIMRIRNRFRISVVLLCSLSGRWGRQGHKVN